MKRKLFSKSSSVQNHFQACEVLNGYERFFVLIPSDGWDFLLYLLCDMYKYLEADAQLDSIGKFRFVKCGAVLLSMQIIVGMISLCIEHYLELMYHAICLAMDIEQLMKQTKPLPGLGVSCTS